MRATSMGLGMVVAVLILGAASPSSAQCSGVLNSECMNPDNPEYNSYRCSQQRACDSKSSTSHIPTYGAIAYSRATQSYGWDFSVSPAWAAQRALVQCRKVLRESGVDKDDCDASNTWFKSPWCGSLAQSDNGAYAIMTGPTGVEANRKAMAACKGNGGVDCKIADGMPQCATD